MDRHKLAVKVETHFLLMNKKLNQQHKKCHHKEQYRNEPAVLQRISEYSREFFNALFNRIFCPADKQAGNKRKTSRTS